MPQKEKLYGKLYGQLKFLGKSDDLIWCDPMYFESDIEKHNE